MRVLVVAVGRIRGGPEMDLARDYLERATAAGRQLALGPVELIEVEAKAPADPRKEAAALLKATPDGSRTVLLDERGEAWTSRQLADQVARWRDEGASCLTFWIGGPDGAAQGLRDQADKKLALGRLTWPHKLVRPMICEQIYRSVMILSANPYHRD